MKPMGGVCALRDKTSYLDNNLWDKINKAVEDMLGGYLGYIKD